MPNVYVVGSEKLPVEFAGKSNFKKAKEIELNFKNKKNGYDIYNFNSMYKRVRSDFPAPTIYDSACSNGEYLDVEAQDGTFMQPTEFDNGAVGTTAQFILEYDILNSVKANPGFSNIQSIAELKALAKRLQYRVVGYAQGGNGGAVGYGIEAKVWRPADNTWGVFGEHTSSANKEILFETPNSVHINDSTGKVYWCVNSKFPTTALYKSKVFIDYPSLSITLKDGSFLTVDPSPKEVIIKGRDRHVSIEDVAITTEKTFLFDVDYIHTISNDSDPNSADAADIILNFDYHTRLTNNMTLKPGEVISDFSLNCKTMTVKSKSGSQPFRAWGLK